MSWNKAPLVERFWSRVDKNGPVKSHVGTPCWVWTGGRDGKGYGRICSLGKYQRAHRVSYVLSNGDIPNGMHIDHICHTKLCVNADHLRVATRSENMQNLSGPYRRSTSGVRGVSWHKASGRWRVSVSANGKFHSGGYFNDLKDAELAAINLRNQLHTRNDIDRAG